jgi:hypothetical protein
VSDQAGSSRSDPGSERRFLFRFAPGYRVAALLFGITPQTAHVALSQRDLRVHFGPWRLRTSRSNVAGVEQTGGFAFLKTAGPPHLSFTDHGITFATNGDQALCVRFHEPVKVFDPTGRFLRHPGATLTVADPPALARALG